MQLKDLARQPQLIKKTLSDEAIMAEYGEAIEFWTWDRQPMSTFLKLAAVDASNYSTVFAAVRELVLDAEGNQILTEDVMLPTPVLMRVITEVVDSLGKSSPQN
jgi:hypothetical protein